MSLASLLVRDRVLPVRRIEEALQTQVVAGGDLGTILLEMDAIPENVLASYLAAVTHFLPAAKSEVMTPGKSALGFLTPIDAERLRLLPIAIERGTMIFAGLAPVAPEVEEFLKDRSGFEVTVRIACEARLAAGLHKHYGIALSVRHERLLEALEQRSAGEIVFVAPLSEPKSVAPEKRGPIALPVDGAAMRRRLRGPLPFTQAISLLGAAESRDEVLEILFAFFRQYFDYAALFVVQGDTADGHDAFGRGTTADDILKIAIPLDIPSTFGEVKQTMTPWLGPLINSELDKMVIEDLKRMTGVPAYVCPVAIRGRTVVLLYGDRSGEDFAPSDLADLTRLISKVTERFEQLILLRKRLSSHAPDARQDLRSDGRTSAGRSVGQDRDMSARQDQTPVSHALSVVEPPSISSIRPAVRTPFPPETYEDSGVTQRAPLISRNLADAIRSSTVPPVAEPVIEPVAEAGPAPMAARRAEDEVPREPLLRKSRVPTLGQTSAVRQTPRPPAVEQTKSKPTPPDAPRSGAYSASGITETLDARPTAPKRPSPPTVPLNHHVEHIDARGVSAPRNPPSVPSAGQRINETGSVEVDMGETIRHLVNELMRCGPDDEAGVIAMLLRHGEAPLPSLVHVFPGPLWFNRHNPHRRVPRGKDISAVARAMFAYKERAAPYVASLLESHLPDRRFYATLLAGDLLHPTLTLSLMMRLVDDDEDIRSQASSLLVAYRAFEPIFSDGLGWLRSALARTDIGIYQREHVIDALSFFKDPLAVEHLVPLLADGPHSVSAHRALMQITFSDYGPTNQAAYLAWSAAQSHKPRAEWLIDLLTADDERHREAAFEELRNTTQQYFGYHPKASKREREVAQAKYRKWWSERTAQNPNVTPT